MLKNLLLHLLVESGLVQRCVCVCTIACVCVWVTALTAFLRYDKSHPHCFSSSSTVNLFLFLLSTQLPAERSASPLRTQRLLCVLFPRSRCVSTWLFMLKFKTSCKMSSLVSPLLKLFLISLVLTRRLEQIVSVQLQSFLPVSCRWFFSFVWFVTLCTAGSTSLFAYGLTGYSTPPLYSSSFICFFH